MRDLDRDVHIAKERFVRGECRFFEFGVGEGFRLAKLKLQDAGVEFEDRWQIVSLVNESVSSLSKLVIMIYAPAEFWKGYEVMVRQMAEARFTGVRNLWPETDEKIDLVIAMHKEWAKTYWLGGSDV